MAIQSSGAGRQTWTGSWAEAGLIPRGAGGTPVRGCRYVLRLRAPELRQALRDLAALLDLYALEGDRVIEVKASAFDKQRFLDLVRHFIVFEDFGGGKLVKKVAGYHQFHAVNVAVEETLRAAQVAAAVRVADLGCPPANQDAAALSSIGIGNQVGQVAPDFTLPDLFTLSSFRGCPVILYFWATWCKPCLNVTPKLEALRQRYQERGLKVVAVSLDHRQEDAARYLEANGFKDFMALRGSFAEARNVALTYGVSAIPRTILVDRQGIIRFVGHPQDLTEAIVSPWL